MPAVQFSVGDLRRAALDPGAAPPGRSDAQGPSAPTVAVVDLDGDRGVLDDGFGDMALPFGWPVVVIGTSDDPDLRPELCDVVVGVDEPDAIAAVVAGVERNPVAAMTLVTLLRTGAHRSVSAGLLAESGCYSALQSGREFARWRAARPTRPVRSHPDPVLGVRDADELRITLNRPDRGNALDVSVRDALAELVAMAIVDDSIRSVVLDGAGPSFCTGGDLDEFGTAPDPATAHLVRLERSLGALFHALADRMTVYLHGSCIGSGIELPAFAREVVASPDVQIRLPELSMGLVPGAGGTVSLTRRAGRHRVCRLALSGSTIGVATAREWGLVDRIAPVRPTG